MMNPKVTQKLFIKYVHLYNIVLLLDLANMVPSTFDSIFNIYAWCYMCASYSLHVLYVLYTVCEQLYTSACDHRYMKRRCAFLDQLPAFNYNTGYGEYFVEPLTGKKKLSDTRQLGSTLMETMLQEVKDFCDPEIKENWSLKAHQQVYILVNRLSQKLTITSISMQYS